WHLVAPICVRSTSLAHDIIDPLLNWRSVRYRDTCWNMKPNLPVLPSILIFPNFANPVASAIYRCPLCTCGAEFFNVVMAFSPRGRGIDRYSLRRRMSSVQQLVSFPKNLSL